MLATQSSLLTASTVTPVGFLIRVRAPLITRVGATSPLSVTLKTSTESSASLATKISPRPSWSATWLGQFNCVRGPLMTRRGGVFPWAPLEWMVIEGKSNHPPPPPPSSPSPPPPPPPGPANKPGMPRRPVSSSIDFDQIFEYSSQLRGVLGGWGAERSR